MRWSFFTRIVLVLSAAFFFSVACRGESSEIGSETRAPVGESTSADLSSDPDGAPAVGASSASATLPAAGAGDSGGNSLLFGFGQTLAALGDYQLVVEVRFQGQDAAGLPVSFEASGVETVVFDPSFRRIDLSGEGSGGRTSQSVSFISQDDVAYLYVPEIGCISGRGREFDSEMRLPLDPAGLLNGQIFLNPVSGSVVRDGRESTEYRFDETSLPWASSGGWSVDGTVLVDVGTGYVSRVDMNVSGKGDIMGEGRTLDGQYTVVIVVAELASVEQAKLPEACNGSTLYPVTPDAYEVATIEELLSFKSAMPLDEVVDFYLDAMPAAGWQLSSEPDVFEDLAIMNFERNGALLLINLEFDDESGSIDVLISP